MCSLPVPSNASRASWPTSGADTLSSPSLLSLPAPGPKCIYLQDPGNSWHGIPPCPVMDNSPRFSFTRRKFHSTLSPRTPPYALQEHLFPQHSWEQKCCIDVRACSSLLENIFFLFCFRVKGLTLNSRGLSTEDHPSTRTPGSLKSPGIMRRPKIALA